MEPLVKEVKITTEYITLGQLLKFVGIIYGGGEVKEYIASHTIFVNKEGCKQRGKKLRPGDEVNIDNELFYKVTSDAD